MEQYPVWTFQQAIIVMIAQVPATVWLSCLPVIFPLSLSILNSLRAKFSSGNINMYLHFMSFLHADMQ